MGGLREVAAPFVVPGPTGVAVRTRLKNLTAQDEKVLRLVGDHLGSLASRDLKARCTAGLDHGSEQWAQRKRVLTQESSSRWAGSITKATHDQWALARRGQLAHIHSLEAGVRTITHRLSLPMGKKGGKRAPGGYHSRQEWFAKSRRMHLLEDRLQVARADRDAGVVHVVRGGKQLLTTRHHLDAARLTEEQWRRRWQAGRRFLQADGESGKRFGNETIRVTPGGEVSLKLPAPLAHLANAPHGRYVLTARVGFAHRGEQWADRVTANRAVAYRIHEDAGRGRWYLTASWTIPPAPAVPLAAARAGGLVGVDTNADHLAAWRLDAHGNPVGAPRRFDYDLTGNAAHRDAQIRHALIRLLHWAKRHGLAIAVEDLDFAAEKTREKHGRKKRFRNLISGLPVGRLRARLASMAAELGIPVIAVDPAYTSRWGAQHWQKPLTSKNRKTTRHHAAAVAIGRRALGHPVRRRTAPPPAHRSDEQGHRTVQARPAAPGREGTRPRIPGPRTRSMRAGRGAKAGDQCAQHRSGHAAEHGSWQQDSLPLSLQEW
ncbi:IS200/IS605 family accessory protein TnpB-related protein [Streptomyces ipomoeae]|uniref:IS200/IS605 family accessory protein TnpB-related protein n=1 Tax=Streptomyces ipomoeae TaxID=103232 RepID=UPI0002EFA362|nr:IS200/IS605 family accessory protein TnpB-related protein [Streptomyces ipomoeae]MDX2881067.1 IS200/IS605 family accessory protein TnpB-related protein [Streptomyces ipomoeae]TQE34453.1 transposase [Streptomyces ipomoeae]